MPRTGSTPAAMRRKAAIPLDPRAVEATIGSHPARDEACAEAITLVAMKAFVADGIGRHGMIGAREVRDARPRTPVGELSKTTLVNEEAALRAGKP